MANCEADEWLMGQVALGKQEHLEPLVRRYASPLLTYLQRMIGDRHRGEELFQDVFLAVWLKRHTYRFPRSFRTWLFAIATNRCRADFRRARPPTIGLAESAETAPASSGPSPLETAISTETATLVETAVARLPQQQRTVVVLRIWNQLSYGEIAETVGRSEGTVRSHMHHGLAAMRQYLEPHCR